METISIYIAGPDLETINITLTGAEVKYLYESNNEFKARSKCMYETNKEFKAKVEQLTKNYDYEKRMKEHYSKESDKFREELNGMHALFNAFEVPGRYENKNMYSEMTYPLATRMALFLSKNRLIILDALCLTQQHHKGATNE